MMGIPTQHCVSRAGGKRWASTPTLRIRIAEMRRSVMRSRLIIPMAFVLFGIALPAIAADAPNAPAPATPALRTKLPDEHPYQQALRKYLASLSEKDFDHGIKEL